MRRLTVEEANQHLASVHLKIGIWSQVCDATEHPFQAFEWINHAAPDRALPLYSFSHHVLQWLEPGAWTLVQIDDSTCFNEDEDFLISRLLFGPQVCGLLIESRSFLFEFGKPDTLQEQWLLGDLLHLMLLFGGHCQVVSAGSVQGQYLSVQDGYVYFLSRDPKDLAKAREVLEQTEDAPLESPPAD